MAESVRVLCVLADDQTLAAQKQLPELVTAGSAVAYQPFADDALAELPELDPELVIVGMSVGDMDGLEILAELFRRHPNFAGKVVVLPDEGDPFPPMLQFRDPDSGRSSTSESDLDQVRGMIAQIAPSQPATAAGADAGTSWPALDPKRAPQRKVTPAKVSPPQAVAVSSTKQVEPATPAAAKPAVPKPSPAAAKPVAAKPVVAKPVVAKPVAAKPVAAKPAVAKPTAPKPAAPKPGDVVSRPIASVAKSSDGAQPAVPRIAAAPVVITSSNAQDSNTIPAPPNPGLLKKLTSSDDGASSSSVARAAEVSRDSVPADEEASRTTLPGDEEQSRSALPGDPAPAASSGASAGTPNAPLPGAPTIADDIASLTATIDSGSDTQLVDSQGGFRLASLDETAPADVTPDPALAATIVAGPGEPGGSTPVLDSHTPTLGAVVSGDEFESPPPAAAPRSSRVILIGVLVVALLAIVVTVIVVAVFATGSRASDRVEGETTVAESPTETEPTVASPKATDKPAAAPDQPAPTASATVADPPPTGALHQPVALPLKFDHGAEMYTVTDQERLTLILSAARQALEEDPAAVIEFGGHTSVEGAPTANLRLGALRADRARKDFQGQLPWKRTKSRSYGASQPLGGDPILDRRVTIVLSH